MNTKPNTFFWIVGVFGLLWNLMGVFAFLSQHYFITEELKTTLPKNQIYLINNNPEWLTLVFAASVFSGLLGSIMLLSRKKWAIGLYFTSLVMVLIQNIYGWAIMKAAEIHGIFQGYLMPIIVIISSIFLYFYSKSCSAKKWIK